MKTLRTAWLLLAIAAAGCSDDPPLFFPADAEPDVGEEVGEDADPGDAADLGADTTDVWPDSSDADLDAEPADVAADSGEDARLDTEEPEVVEDTGPLPSGCGRAPIHRSGGEQVEFDAGRDWGGLRGFYLSLPDDYDTDVPHALYVGYAGTNWVGQQIQPYLNLEDGRRGDEIFVYPDPLWREFEGWGTLGGWVLGPYAQPAHGLGDTVFTEAVLDYMSENYCVDTDRVFATGHSWGGDIAAVVACFLGDRFTAVAPVAANRPYWFEPEGEGGPWATCEGEPAVWTWFGIADDHFSWQDFPGQFGDQQRDFWFQERSCDGPDAYRILEIPGAGDECVAFDGCDAETLYCLYGPDSRHQVPAYFSEAVMEFFRGFEG